MEFSHHPPLGPFGRVSDCCLLTVITGEGEAGLACRWKNNFQRAKNTTTRKRACESHQIDRLTRARRAGIIINFQCQISQAIQHSQSCVLFKGSLPFPNVPTTIACRLLLLASSIRILAGGLVCQNSADGEPVFRSIKGLNPNNIECRYGLR